MRSVQIKVNDDHTVSAYLIENDDHHFVDHYDTLIELFKSNWFTRAQWWLIKLN